MDMSFNKVSFIVKLLVIKMKKITHLLIHTITKLKPNIWTNVTCSKVVQLYFYECLLINQ